MQLDPLTARTYERVWNTGGVPLLLVAAHC
jgi:hypothetical protein